MKIVQSALLALTFFGPVALMSQGAQAQSLDCFDPQNELEEASCNLLGTANLAINALSNLDSNTDVQNARRYTRGLATGSYALGQLISSSATEDAVLTQLSRLSTLSLQLDATQRKLESRYPDNRNLQNRLTRVRAAYLILEGLLLPVEE